MLYNRRSRECTSVPPNLILTMSQMLLISKFFLGPTQSAIKHFTSVQLWDSDWKLKAQVLSNECWDDFSCHINVNKTANCIFSRKWQSDHKTKGMKFCFTLYNPHCTTTKTTALYTSIQSCNWPVNTVYYCIVQTQYS